MPSSIKFIKRFLAGKMAEIDVMPKIKHFIYDLDGTLDDTMPSCTKAFEEVLAEMGITGEELGQEYNNSAGTPLREQFAHALSSRGIVANLDDCCARFWERRQYEKSQPFPGTVPLISEIYRRHGKQYLTTGSTTTHAIARIREIGLLPYFSLVLGQGNGIDKGLQHLQLFKENSQDHNFEKDAVYLGDGTKDMEYARDFGIIAVGITTTLPEQKLRNTGARYIISALDQFLPLIKSME